MKRTTSRSEARQALFKPQAAAAEERKRLELANVGDLTTFVVESAKLCFPCRTPRRRENGVGSPADADPTMGR